MLLPDVIIQRLRVVGYCYARPWKERAAYNKTLETTVYLSPRYQGKGIGRLLMSKLIEECAKRFTLLIIYGIYTNKFFSDAGIDAG